MPQRRDLPGPGRVPRASTTPCCRRRSSSTITHEIAPESPGDLFDSTEIDEILTLRIMTLTDQEKQAVAAVDERARAVLERTGSLARDQLYGLHGMMRSSRQRARGARRHAMSWNPTRTNPEAGKSSASSESNSESAIGSGSGRWACRHPGHRPEGQDRDHRLDRARL